MLKNHETGTDAAQKARRFTETLGCLKDCTIADSPSRSVGLGTGNGGFLLSAFCFLGCSIYSRFIPIFPIFLKPQRLTTSVVVEMAKQNQNAAL